MAENNENLTGEEIRDIKSQYNRAKNILEKVENFYSRFEQLKIKIEDGNNEIDNKLLEIREKNNSIEILKNESAERVVEIKSSLEKINISIVQMNESLQKFENIKGKIESKDNEIDNLVSTANSLKIDIEKAKGDAQNYLTQINNLFGEIQNKIGEMQKTYEGFLEIKGKITDENDGLEAVLNQVKDAQKKSKEIFEEIKSYRDESKDLFDQIKKVKEISDDFNKEIEENLKQVMLKRSEVEKIADLIADTGLANSFQRREKILSRNSKIWLLVISISYIGLVILLYKFFGKLDKIPEISFIIYRISLTSPLLFLIGFATSQYIKERDLNEKYAFKATVAEVMRNHSEFLHDISINGNENIIPFVKDTIQKIYREPYQEEENYDIIKKELNSIINGDGKVQNKDSNKIINSIKELKNLIPDEKLLKDLISILLHR